MIIYGKNPVGEAVKAGKTIDKLYILREESDARMSALVKTAKERGAVVVNADRRQLDKLTDGGNHQGIAARSPTSNIARSRISSPRRKAAAKSRSSCSRTASPTPTTSARY